MQWWHWRTVSAFTKHPALFITVMAVSIVGSACDWSGELAAPDVTSSSVSSVKSLQSHQQLARSLAMALSDKGIRQQLLVAMQKSKFNEHKLILQTFLASGRGSRLLTAAAKASSNTHSSMAEWIADLPADMDFYVPVRDQRRTWRGDREVAVAAILDADAKEALVFYPDGSWRKITRPDDAQVGALFVIHPSEPKNVVRDSETVGPTIERHASSLGSRPMFNETCDETSVDPCDDPGNGGYASTYVGTISIDFADGAFSGDPEIFFVTCPEFGSCETSGERVVPAFGTRTINLVIYPEQASSSQSMKADLWEADSGLNGDHDDKGVSIPDITGEGGYISYDPFYDKVWADYNVFIQ